MLRRVTTQRPPSVTSTSHRCPPPTPLPNSTQTDIAAPELCREVEIKKFKYLSNRSIPSPIAASLLHQKGLFFTISQVFYVGDSAKETHAWMPNSRDSDIYEVKVES